MQMPTRIWDNGSKYRYGFNGQERSTEIHENSFTAEFWEYDSRTGRRWNVDPKIEDAPDFSPYSCLGDNPVLHNDPDGDFWHIVAGAGIGALVGGVIEAGSQLYNTGSVSNWKAVGGAAVQGAITGGAAAATGGASLVTSATAKIAVVGASAVVANVAGGTANRAVQGKTTTGTDIAVDAVTGVVGAGVGYVAGKTVKAGVEKLSNSAKEKIGESVTQTKYFLKGFKSLGKDEVLTGTKTPTGREAKAVFDHLMENRFTGKQITVDAKFTSGDGAKPFNLLTGNQKLALPKLQTPFQYSVVTSKQVGNVGGGSTGQSATTAAANKIK